VRERLPPSAREILEQGTLCYLAVRTHEGPHLTPVVFVLDGGRIWLTTSRTSVKARGLRQDPDVAGMVRLGSSVVTFRGRARTYDALDPLSWPSAAVAGPRLVRAATRFSLKNARFFAGYAVDARRVPLAWTPPGRIFVGIGVVAGAVLDLAEGSVPERWGDWSEGPRGRSRRRRPPSPTARAIDLGVPRSVRSVVGDRGDGALAVGGLAAVLPVTWRRIAREGAYHGVLPRSFLELAGSRPRPRTSPMRAALAVDRLAAWRAANMAGMLLQGEADISALEDDRELVRLRPRRVVWWQGWSSGTVSEAARERR
jgi:Pyridoxamine 5'-phosphate oxidase